MKAPAADKSFWALLLPFVMCGWPTWVRGAQDDVWGLRVAESDNEGVTIEFNYRFTPRKGSSRPNVLAYPLPRFEGLEWDLWRLQPGTGTARIRMYCRNAKAAPSRTDKVYIYMNDRGNVFFSKEFDFPIRWKCARDAPDAQAGPNDCPSFRVSFESLRLDSTTAHVPGVEFPVDQVTVALQVVNAGRSDSGRGELVLRVALEAGGSSARGSIPADGIVFRLSRMRAGERTPFRFRDAFYHGENRRYRAFVTAAPDLAAPQARRIKECLKTDHARMQVNEQSLHRRFSSGSR